jgi:hypothetical protein
MQGGKGPRVKQHGGRRHGRGWISVDAESFEKALGLGWACLCKAGAAADGVGHGDEAVALELQHPQRATAPDLRTHLSREGGGQGGRDRGWRVVG